MKRLFLRILAYGLDSTLVSIIVVLLCSVSFINPQYDKYVEESDKYQAIYKSYINITDKLDDYVEDKKISEEEYIELSDKYPLFISAFEVTSEDEEVNADSFKTKLETIYNSSIQEETYDLAKVSTFVYVITIVANILYFGVLQFFTKGQTLFKKIFRLRVVSTNDEEVPMWKYILRSILINSLIFTVISAILPFVTSQVEYINYSNILELLNEYVYQLMFFLFMLYRQDQRSIHDLILNTKVIRYNKDGSIDESPAFPKLKTNEEIVDKAN